MQVKLTANCMYLAERVDVLSLACLVDQSNLLLNQHAITEQIVAKMGDNFCAELVATFMAIAESSLRWKAVMPVVITRHGKRIPLTKQLNSMN